MKKDSLPKEFGEKWIEALRNTSIKQATCRMRIGDCYCANGIGSVVVGFDLREDDNIYVNDCNKEWYPFIDIVGKNLFTKIYELNDTAKKSFPEIADWIVENVEFV